MTPDLSQYPLRPRVVIRYRGVKLCPEGCR
jgi:hypothetical protein